MEKKNVILPRKNLVHDELLSDEMVSAFAFSSVGCHYMKKVDGNIEMKNSDMDNVCYVSDFGVFKYKVRKSCKIYGAAAYFHSKYKLLCIYVSHLDKQYYPMMVKCGNMQNIFIKQCLFM